MLPVIPVESLGNVVQLVCLFGSLLAAVIGMVLSRPA